VAQWVRLLDYLTTHTSLSPVRRGFTPSFVNYNKGCTRLVAASDKAYQLLAHGRWFSLGTPASSTTKTGRHDIAEILLKVVLNTINQIKSIYKTDSFWLKITEKSIKNSWNQLLWPCVATLDFFQMKIVASVKRKRKSVIFPSFFLTFIYDNIAFKYEQNVFVIFT